MHAAIVGAQDLEEEVIDDDALAAPRQMAETMHHEAADGIEFLIRIIRAEILVEILDRRQRLDGVMRGAVFADRALLLHVMLVLDIADDLLQHILDGDDTGDAAVLVNDDCHVNAVGTEVLEQHIEPLAFRDKHRGPQQFTHIEALLGALYRIDQQILRQQDAHHLVAAVADDRVTRMPGLDDGTQQLLRVGVTFQHVDLGTGYHDVAHPHVIDLQHALDHRQRIGIEQVPLLRDAQQFDQLFAVLGRPQQGAFQARHQGMHLRSANWTSFTHYKSVGYVCFAI